MLIPAPPPRVLLEFVAEPSPDGYVLRIDGAWGSRPLTLAKHDVAVRITALDGTIKRARVPFTFGPARPVADGNGWEIPITMPRRALVPGMQRLQLTLRTGAIRIGGVPASWTGYDGSGKVLAVNVAVPDRRDDARLFRRFRSADVVTYGAVPLGCRSPQPPSASIFAYEGTHLRTTAIVRRTNAAAVLAVSSYGGFRYKALDPLEVTFAPLPRGAFAGGYDLHGGTIHPHACVPTLDAAGAWDLERRITQVPRAAPPPALALGLTHEQVALLRGFPAIYGTREQLSTRGTWDYGDPINDTTVVFRKDRVVALLPHAKSRHP